MSELKLSIAEYSEDIKKFLDDCDQIPVFCEESLLQLVKNTDQPLIYFKFSKFNQLVALIPLVQIPYKFFKSYSTPPLCPFTTILIHPKHRVDETLTSCFALLNSKEFLKKVDQINFSVDFELVDSALNVRKRLTHIIDLQQSEDEIFSKFRSDKKRNIKKQAKEGISVSFEKDTQTLVALIEMTYTRQNKSISWAQLIENLSVQYKNSYQSTAYMNGEPVASLFFVYDSEKAYYLAGGFNDKIGNYNAGPIAMWEGIKHAKNLGLNQFDFEGSRVESIRNYFLSFGSNPVEFPVYSYQSFKFKLYQWIKRFK